MSFLRYSRLLVPLLAVACSVPLLAATSGVAAAGLPKAPAGVAAQIADPADEHDVLDRPRHGTDAQRYLGANVAAIAQRNRVTEAQLRHLLTTDDSLWLDRKGHGFYVEPPLPAAASAPTTASAAAGQYPYGQTFLLHSKPGANRTIFLDFDGATINGTAWNANFGVAANFGATGFDSDGAPGAFSNAEMDLVQSVWERVSEDYSPFDIDVTTQDPGLAALDRADANDQVYGVHAIITSSTALWQSTCASSCGGIAYIGVSDSVAPSHEYYQPAIVFQPGLGANSATAKTVAEATSHEVGHNFGLSHDGTATLAYYSGHDPWAPIMGVGYNRAITQWSKGEYTGANNTEDDLAVMAAHGATPRADDHGNTIATATALPVTSATVRGIIGTATDVDFFVLTATGPATVLAAPADTSPNLDIRLDLYNSVGTLVASNDPAVGLVDRDTVTGLSASVAIPSAGVFYVRVDGVGLGTPSTGYSDYASIGQYFISATITGGTTLATGPTSVFAGDVMTVTFSGIAAPTATDWIGIYPSRGATDTSYIAFRYTTAVASDTVQFTIPLSTRTGTSYELRLFSNNGYARLATSNTFAISATTGPTLTVSPPSIARGGIVNATWTDVTSPRIGDWIGLYANSGAPDVSYLAFSYVSANFWGTVQFTIPVGTPPGTSYELRLFSNNTYTMLARSNTFTVTAPTAPTIAVSPTTTPRGGIVAVTWGGVPSPTVSDWIGLYATSAAGDSTYLGYRYTNGTAAGSVPFTVPANIGAGTTYELRLYSNNGYTRLATSNALNVTAPTPPSVSVNPSSVARGSVITATWAGVPSPTAGDWIALYASGTDPNGGYWTYAYTNGQASGSLELTVPVLPPAGTTYELRLFSNGGYTVLATSAPFTVTAPANPKLDTTPQPVTAGAPATVTWTGIPTPRATDWIGLYRANSTGLADFVAYKYTNGAASGSVQFTIPAGAPPDAYRFRLFSNNGFTELAVTSYFNVTPADCSFDRGGDDLYPAENATISGGTGGVRCFNGNFRGRGYIGDWNGQTVTFAVTSASAGRMNLRIRYQNAGPDATRTLSYPGGSTTVTFHNTHGGDTSGDWAAGLWSDVMVNIPVNAGSNSVSFSGAGGLLDLDQISEARYTGAGLPGVPGGSVAAGTVYQEINANWAGPHIFLTGISPDLYLTQFGYVGDYITYTVTGGGTRTLRFRYRTADTTATAQRLISVNGSSVAILSFPTTGPTWATAAWAEASVTVNLPVNATVTLEFLGDSGHGLIDLDQLTVAV